MKQLTINERILILCEDKKSALYYLNSFKTDENYKRNLLTVNVEIYQPHNFSPLGLVKEAKKRQKEAEEENNPFNKIWIVLDKDGHANLKHALDLVNQTKNMYYALSIICFEYWILLHFEKTAKSFETGDKIIQYIKSKHLPNYKKGTNVFYQIIDKTNFAIKNGKWIEKQVTSTLDSNNNITSVGAYTNIHILVSELIRPRDN